ncbi:MAG: putative porin [Bacteroidota bacterium]
MKQVFFCFFVLISFSIFAQNDQNEAPVRKSLVGTKKTKNGKATINQYKIISLQKDTTFVDTSLTIKSEYKHNYLRKDNFGLLAFPNEGQTYNTLQYSLNSFSPFPEFGYKAKHFNYLEANQINYYSVATPLTELYFKSVMEQGQNLDAFITLNTSEQFNFSLAYKGLRSIGKYINQLSSTGNFRFTTSYTSLSKRYQLNAHYTGQDLLNGENGGITTIQDFEDEDPIYDNRARLNVYFKDATSFLKGKRFFVDHNFRTNAKNAENNLYITHNFNYENKFFEFNQKTTATTIVSSTGDDETFNRFGDAYVASNIQDQVRYNKMYNKVGVIYENTSLGKFHFFIDDFRYNYYYDSVLFIDGVTIPNALNDKINNIGGQYEYQTKKWKANFSYFNAITDQALFNLEGNLKYKFNDKNSLSFGYQKSNKLPNHIYNLHQSSYVNYNWYNDFNNEKINNIKAEATTQWGNTSLQFNTLNDYLFFTNLATGNVNVQQLIRPTQYNKTINYLSLKVNKEFKVGKFALDNTVLYQKTDQEDDILNVPQLVTRNTLYYSNRFFKKAMYLQTGVILNYFTKYYANDYNPLIGEFFVQNNKEIGAYPNLDFFVNARIQQCRIFLKAEHFNSSFSGNNFYSGPNQPYRDFIIRFGLTWNFFQ